jgi:hypothetical protein
MGYKSTRISAGEEASYEPIKRQRALYRWLSIGEEKGKLEDQDRDSRPGEEA